jgi:hypothetical protein
VKTGIFRLSSFWVSARCRFRPHDRQPDITASGRFRLNGHLLRLYSGDLLVFSGKVAASIGISAVPTDDCHLPDENSGTGISGRQAIAAYSYMALTRSSSPYFAPCDNKKKRKLKWSSSDRIEDREDRFPDSGYHSTCMISAQCSAPFRLPHDGNLNAGMRRYGHVISTRRRCIDEYCYNIPDITVEQLQSMDRF